VIRHAAIIERDCSSRTQLRAAAETAGLHADLFDRAAPALTLLRERSYCLVIVDLAIADTDPYALCREVSPLVPVIALTDTPDPEVFVRAFESGADDCLRRPIAHRELVARIRNVIRRANAGRTIEEERFADLSLVISEMRVRIGNKASDLTRGETELLAALLSHAPSPVTIDRIAQDLGAKRATIGSRIKSLRKKLGPDRIVSRGKFGYQIERD
jgi:DNA-binding response OmpR family regulator